MARSLVAVHSVTTVKLWNPATGELLRAGAATGRQHVDALVEAEGAQRGSVGRLSGSLQALPLVA